MIEATSKEEEIHGRFGITLFQILKQEKPEYFTEKFNDRLNEMAFTAFEAELKIIDWIYENGDIESAPKALVIDYMKNRYNNSLEILGLGRPYEVSKESIDKTYWFDVELLTTKDIDFFNKRSTEYTKRSVAITAENIF